MNRKPGPHRLTAIACATALVTATLLHSPPADAGERQGRRAQPARTAQAQKAPRAQSREVQTQRTPTGKERSTVWTGQNGKTATRDATVTRDPDAGTRTREVAATGPNGQTRTTSDVTTRTDDGYARETVTTNPNGSTQSRSVTGSYDADTQTWSKTVERDREPAPMATE